MHMDQSTYLEGTGSIKSFVMSFINAGARKKSAKRARTITVPVERPNVKVVFNFPVMET